MWHISVFRKHIPECLNLDMPVMTSSVKQILSNTYLLTEESLKLNAAGGSSLLCFLSKYNFTKIEINSQDDVVRNSWMSAQINYGKKNVQ